MSGQILLFRRLFLNLTLIAVIASPTSGISAETQTLRIVTEAYPPFVYQEDGVATGIDWETIELVLKQMGFSVSLQFCPWKRCVLMVQTGIADAILDISKTPERERQLVFPDESISRSPTVLFKRRDDVIPYSQLSDLDGLKAATVLGYSYCDQLDNASFHIEEGTNLRNNFRKLLRGRVDIVIETVIVGRFVLNEMGLDDRITMVPKASFCDNDANYLAFSNTPAHRAIADQFSQALRNFKASALYQQILSRYGLNDSVAFQH